MHLLILEGPATNPVGFRQACEQAQKSECQTDEALDVVAAPLQAPA